MGTLLNAVSHAFCLHRAAALSHTACRFLSCCCHCPGGFVRCTLALINAGSITLTDISIPGQLACADLPSLTANDSIACVISYPVAPQDFYNWDEAGQLMVLHVSANAVPENNPEAAFSAGVNAPLPLVAQPSIVLRQVVPSVTSADRAGE